MSSDVILQSQPDNPTENIDAIPEAPFYIPSTGPTTRPRRALKYGDTFIVLDSHGDIGASPGGPDGLKVDTAGNVYCGGAGGIYILDPQGKKLGRIVHGQPATTNIGFGGDDLKTLFFTSRSHLGSVNIKIAGIPAPPPKKT